MPKGYQFVPKGDVYITSNVRKRTHAAGATLYVVVDKHRKPIGLRCPATVVQEVTEAAQATKARRAAVVQTRDAAAERDFKTELLRLYPKVPPEDIPQILGQTLEKRSRRVGRTRTLDLESKVHLAVKAHIRHCRTPYEQLLRDGVERGEARRRVTALLDKVCSSWSGSTGPVDAHIPPQIRKDKTLHDQSRAGDSSRNMNSTEQTPRSRPKLELEARDEAQTVNEETGCEDSEGGVIWISDDDSEDSDWTPNMSS
jgi:hypothetical protein